MVKKYDVKTPEQNVDTHRKHEGRFLDSYNSLLAFTLSGEYHSKIQKRTGAR